MPQYHVEFEPVGRRGSCESGQSLLECARRLGVDLVSICGAKGTCGRCKVQILSGAVSDSTATEKQLLSPEELSRGYRLACHTYPMGNVKVSVPTESLTAPQRTQVEGFEVAISPDPPVLAYDVEMTRPSLANLGADSTRLLQALTENHGVRCRAIDLEALREMPIRLREASWRVRTFVRDREVVKVGPQGSRALGLAVDLGTTKLAGYLVDLGNGQTLAAKGVMNPQIAYGEDVIARLAHVASSRGGAAELQGIIVHAVNQLAADLCTEVGRRPDEIVEAVLVGNTAMHHLFLRLPVSQLGLSPYVPAVSEALDVKAREVGLEIARGAYAHLLPNIAGFVGADHVAMLLATDIQRAEGLVLALDIGTNTEVCLASDGEMVSASCASGPAFEGAHIRHGMRAAPGAIEHMRMVDGNIEYQTIGGAAPVGICGSGILDALAELRRAGVIDRTGRMADHPRVRGNAREREFVLVSESEREGQPAITVTQRDVRELQLAKAAIRTGIQLLLKSKGRSEADIAEVIIAGAFGTYIDVASAVAVGMLPPLPLGRFRQVGNAAGMGAKLALISLAKRAEAQALAKRVRYIELAVDPDFAETFARANYLG